MYFFESHEMQAVDRETISSGISGEVLMSRASRKLAGELLFFSDRSPRPVHVLCGPGNNGGDGFGLAIHLHQQGWPVEIWLAMPVEKIKGDAALFFNRAKESGIVYRTFSNQQDWDRAELFLQPGAWLVDALLGTGSQEAPRGVLATAVQFLMRYQKEFPIWSVDLPSGLDPNSGRAFDKNCCVEADFTLTLGGAKSGFTFEHSLQWTGSISVLDLGFDAKLLEAHGCLNSPQCVTDREAADFLTEPSRDAHKGSRGHLLLIGGSIGMTGSISLSAKAATASGCGLVSILAPFSCAHVVDAAVPESILIHGKQGKFMSLSTQNLYLKNYNAVAAGPGMRVNIDSIELTSRILKECQGPLLFDADALNSLSMIERDQQKTSAPFWITPHPGEMARLLNCGVQQVSENRSEAVKRAAAVYGAWTVLKGAHSRMASPEGVEWLNLNGNSGMAKGGSGDVLTGLLGSVLAQGIAHETALPLAVYLHGKAGDLAACRFGRSGMKAGDIADALPAVLQHLKGR